MTIIPTSLCNRIGGAFRSAIALLLVASVFSPTDLAAQGLPVQNGPMLPVALWWIGALILGLALAYGIFRNRSRTRAEKVANRTGHQEALRGGGARRASIRKTVTFPEPQLLSYRCRRISTLSTSLCKSDVSQALLSGISAREAGHVYLAAVGRARVLTAVYGSTPVL